MTKLPKDVEERFDKHFEDWGFDKQDANEIKQFLAEELERVKNERE
jgi:hypothetical protein